MKAVIIAGGKGERLRPLTYTMPKPMIDVNGKPVLLHVVNLFKQYGITDFIFALCYLPKLIIDFFGDGKRLGISIAYTFEDENKPLGTAGAIVPTKPYIKDDFIVTYADILRDLDIGKIIAFHNKKKSFATLDTYKRFGPNPKSAIMFNSKNQITEFKERPKKEELASDFVWANGSFYIFKKEIFSFIPKDKPSDFGKDIFPNLIQKKKNLFAFPTDGYFIDIGNTEKLEKARKSWS